MKAKNNCGDFWGNYLKFYADSFCTSLMIVQLHALYNNIQIARICASWW